MKNSNELSAVWLPIFSKEALFWILGISALFISSLVIFLPATATTEQEMQLFKLMISIPDVGYNASLSRIPFCLAVSYGMTLIFIPLLAVIGCCTRLYLGRGLSQFQKLKIHSRIIRALGIILLISIPYLFPLTISPGHLGHGTLLLICNYRFFLLIFCSLMLIAFSSFWLVIALEFKNFISYLTNRSLHGTDNI